MATRWFYWCQPSNWGQGGAPCNNVYSCEVGVAYEVCSGKSAQLEIRANLPTYIIELLVTRDSPCMDFSGSGNEWIMVITMFPCGMGKLTRMAT